METDPPDRSVVTKTVLGFRRVVARKEYRNIVSVIVFGEAGAWRPTEDLIENTGKGIETLVRLGETIARRDEASG